MLDLVGFQLDCFDTIHLCMRKTLRQFCGGCGRVSKMIHHLYSKEAYCGLVYKEKKFFLGIVTIKLLLFWLDIIIILMIIIMMIAVFFFFVYYLNFWPTTEMLFYLNWEQEILSRKQFPETKSEKNILLQVFQDVDFFLSSFDSQPIHRCCYWCWPYSANDFIFYKCVCV